MDIKELMVEITNLHQAGAVHVKRGYKMSDATAAVSSNHLIEEAAEYQAALMSEDVEARTEEAADVLLCYLQTLRHGEIDLEQVIKVADEKLHRVWTTDLSKVTAIKPGFTRRGRAPVP